MKTYIKFFIVLLTVSLSFSCSKESESESIDNGNTGNSSMETEILSLLNNHRTGKGLIKLEISKIIKTQTDAHTNYMIGKNDISHDDFKQRSDYLKQNDNAKSVAENVAFGYSSAKAVVNGWLNSSGHKKNIEGNYTHFNLTAKQNSKGTWYYTNIFISK